MDKIYFVSNSKEKFEEIKHIASRQKPDWEVCWKKASLEEVQEEKGDKLIRKKALEAFKLLRRPVLVEHTALIIHAFNELPGFHTNYFYSTLGYEKIIKYCSLEKDYKACVKSVFCLCDGIRYYIGEGAEEGEIVCSTDGISQEKGFGWDIIFIPEKDNPERKVYAYLYDGENNHLMRRLAWENMVKKYGETSPLLSVSKNQITLKFNELAELIVDKKVMLFVGAGISASVDFPSWKELIDILGSNLGYEADLFESYGDYKMLAEYASSIDKKEVDQQLQETFKITDNIKKKLDSSPIYGIIEKLDFPIIYTTNYDSLLEEYYANKNKEITVIKKIEDMKKIKTGIPRIMKFHGDITDERGKVLTESQYFERMDFSNFMDVQLQADMLQYHILFLGYSLSDVNVKMLMYLARKRDNEEQGQAIESYIYTATPNYVQEKVFLENNIITFTGNEEDKEKGTLNFLESLLEKCEMLSASVKRNTMLSGTNTNGGRK